MKTLALITAALTLATRMAAAESILAAAPIYTSASDASELCVVTNYSEVAVVLTSVAITNDQGNISVTPTQNSCVGPIGSGTSCSFSAPLPSHYQGYGCVVTTKTSAKNVAFMRMTNEQLDSNGNGLYNEPGY